MHNRTPTNKLMDNFLARNMSASNRTALMDDLGGPRTLAATVLTYTGIAMTTDFFTIDTLVVTFEDDSASTANSIVLDTATLGTIDKDQYATAVKEFINGEISSIVGVTFVRQAFIPFRAKLTASDAVTINPVNYGSVGNDLDSTSTIANGGFAAVVFSGALDPMVTAESFSTAASFAGDPTAAIGGVPIGGIYRVDGGTLAWRTA